MSYFSDNFTRFTTNPATFEEAIVILLTQFFFKFFATLIKKKLYLKNKNKSEMETDQTEESKIVNQ